jgi:hypothetical protein
LVGLIKTIAILVLVYYAFKFFSRYIAPFFLKKVIDNVEKKYKQQQQQQQQNQNQNHDENVKVGETVIAKKPSNTKEINKDVGDYVDYEELND